MRYKLYLVWKSDNFVANMRKNAEKSIDKFIVSHSIIFIFKNDTSSKIILQLWTNSLSNSDQWSKNWLIYDLCFQMIAGVNKDFWNISYYSIVHFSS